MTPQQIRALRARYEETQEEFSRRVGVGRHAVRSWEHGKARPSRLAQDRLDQILRAAPADPLTQA